MKISMTMPYAGGDFRDAAERVVDFERAGLDQVWVAEAWGFDAPSQVGYLAALTERVEIGTGILNVYSRTPGLVAMTAAGCDFLTGGRFNLGIGASGPQVIEGFHGVPYVAPAQRIREYIEACRTVWRRETPFVHQGATVDVPLSTGGTGLGKALKLIDHPVRPSIPIWWASLKDRSVELTAAIADGWMPLFFVPEQANRVWGESLRRGLTRRDPALGPLQIISGGRFAVGEHLVGEEQARVLERERKHVALYVGGMGARDKNFYNDIFRAYGYEHEARTIQDLYLAGRKSEAAAQVPADFLRHANLVGTRDFLADRIAAYRAAGVTSLQIEPCGDDPVREIEILRQIIDET